MIARLRNRCARRFRGAAKPFTEALLHHAPRRFVAVPVNVPAGTFAEVERRAPQDPVPFEDVRALRELQLAELGRVRCPKFLSARPPKRGTRQRETPRR